MQLGLFKVAGEPAPRRTILLGGTRRDASWMDNIKARAKVLRRASAPPKPKKKKVEIEVEHKTLRPGEETQMRIPGL